MAAVESLCTTLTSMLPGLDREQFEMLWDAVNEERERRNALRKSGNIMEYMNQHYQGPLKPLFATDGRCGPRLGVVFNDDPDQSTAYRLCIDGYCPQELYYVPMYGRDFSERLFKISKWGFDRCVYGADTVLDNLHPGAKSEFMEMHEAKLCELIADPHEAFVEWVKLIMLSIRCPC